jgi:hypothetical protein
MPRVTCHKVAFDFLGSQKKYTDFSNIMKSVRMKTGEEG